MHKKIPVKTIETVKYTQMEGRPPFEKTVQFLSISNHNDSSRLRCVISASSEKENTFFLAQNRWTCYRRNYCDITAFFTLIPEDQSNTANLPWDSYFAVIDGQPCKIVEFKFAISCRSGDSKAKEEMVQNTSKREKVTATSRRIVVLPFFANLRGFGTKAIFDRMNFASSTSNIASKKEKGYKRLVLDLLATTNDGRTIIIATSESVKLVVRSHSKEHYNDQAKEEPQSASNTVTSTSPYSFTDQYFSPSPRGLYHSGGSEIFYQPSPSGSELHQYQSDGLDPALTNPSPAISETLQYHPSPSSDYPYHLNSPTVLYPFSSDQFGFANMSIGTPYPAPLYPPYLPPRDRGYPPTIDTAYSNLNDHGYIQNDRAPILDAREPASGYVTSNQICEPVQLSGHCLPTTDRLEEYFNAPYEIGYEYPLEVSVPLGAIDSRVDEPDEDEA